MHPILLPVECLFPIAHHVSESLCGMYRKGCRDVPKLPLPPLRNVRFDQDNIRKPSINTGNFGMYRNLTIREKESWVKERIAGFSGEGLLMLSGRGTGIMSANKYMTPAPYTCLLPVIIKNDGFYSSVGSSACMSVRMSWPMVANGGG